MTTQFIPSPIHFSCKKGPIPALIKKVLCVTRDQSTFSDSDDDFGDLGIISAEGALVNHSLPLAAAVGLTRCSNCSIFHSLFYARKGPFSCLCWKKYYMQHGSYLLFQTRMVILSTRVSIGRQRPKAPEWATGAPSPSSLEKLNFPL